MMHAQKLNWVSAFVGGGIAVWGQAYCLFEMAFTAVKRADDLALGELEGGGMVLMKFGSDRSVARELEADECTAFLTLPPLSSLKNQENLIVFWDRIDFS